MKIIEQQQVEQQLTMDKCIDLMREALANAAAGKYEQPLRKICTFPKGHMFGFMPAYLGDCFGAKVINAYPGNAGTEYPTHIGYVMMFEAEHGTVMGLVDANSITKLRTGAVSGVATDLLARKDASVLALIGAGAQGRSHLAAMREVRQIREVKIYDLRPESAAQLAREAEALGIKAHVSSSVKDAVENADIICTLTPAKEAYLKAEWVKDGAHINAVGAFTPTAREITSELVAASRLYADSVESMKSECGEFLIPKSEGLIDDSHIAGALGDIINGVIPGRQNDQEITLFDALGLAVEDVICARYMCLIE